MSDLPTHSIRLAGLPTRKRSHFTIEPDSDARKALARALDVLQIKKLKFEGALIPTGRRDWRIEAKLGATVSQACVVTLDPVTTRIDEDVSRRYLAEVAEIEAAEIEMPEDDNIDLLPDSLDVAQVMIEALSLALPAYPRVEGADLEQVNFSKPGTAAMTDDDAKPFAGLSSLKEALEKREE